jgi:kojibiose phosphorylase
MNSAPTAVIFDLDGVLTDTAELHYLSWRQLMEELGRPFDRAANEALRGLSRPESLEKILADQSDLYSSDQKRDLLKRKNDDYVSRVRRMTPDDLFPGAGELLQELRRRGVRTAVASSSRNAELVLDRLQIRDLLDALVDGNDVPKSKPDPEVFVEAARRVGVEPRRCVVVEDAESGVDGARAGGMRVVGIGPVERVGAADVVKRAIADVTADELIALAQ